MTSRERQPLIDDILAGSLVPPETGRPLAPGIRRIVIEASLEGREAALLLDAGVAGALAVVGDENTLPVLGERVARAVSGARLVELRHPRSDEPTVSRLLDLCHGADALVAVGSGTINDLCKYAAHVSGRPYAVFATAPSMDGYVTRTVSLERGGYKVSLPATPPRGAFFDLEVLARAPRRMIRAGLGDTLCRSTAQLDWRLSHRLLDTPYAETPYDLLREDEKALFAIVDRLPEGDPAAIRLLCRLLVLSGLGTLVTGTSHCGSMGEHAISHYLDMFLRPHPGTLHGEQVGIATWTMARLQARMLEMEELPRLRALVFDVDDFRRRYGRAAHSCLAAARRKPLDEEGVRGLQKRLDRDWRDIRAELRARMLPIPVMESVIRRAGLPFRAGELGIDPAFYRTAVRHALEIRDRYGFLDLAAQAGVLDPFAQAEE